MTDAQALRALGAEGLAHVIGLRPDVLRPVPPRSLGELAARLGHRNSVHLAMRRWSLPTLQVTEAMAALMTVQGQVGRSALDRLLGVEGSDDDGVDAALDVMRQYLLLDGSGGPVPGLVAGWAAPLGLVFPVSYALRQMSVAQLKAALTLWGAPTGGLKADLCDRLQALLADGDQVREMVAHAPEAVARDLHRAALGANGLNVGYEYQRRSPMQWALDRLLLVRVSYEGQALLPAEVVLALRGAGWTAPFEPVPPPLPWVAVESSRIRGDAAAASGHALRLATDLLRFAGSTPLTVRKDGTLGVRELRRVAKALGCPVAEVRLAMSLTHGVGLIGWGEAGLAPTRLADLWTAQPPAARLAALVESWSVSPVTVLDQPEAAWTPAADDDISPLRWACLMALSAVPCQAPANPRALADWALWRLPLVGASSPAQDGPAVDPLARALAVLAEAAWLGVTGSGALSRLGIAMTDGTDLAAALEEALGTVHETARLQGDLTAVVLGQPSATLAATLDALAVREAGSTAMTWRLSPASIRAALDAGESADTILTALDRIGAGDVPQPMGYLVNDVARGHGRIRSGTAACYLRSTDVALLAEAAADSRLRVLGLQVIAPGVLIGTQPLAQTLTAMRRAGYSPVEEAQDGSTLLVRAPSHRVGPVVVGAGAASDPDQPPERVVTLADVAADLLSLPDRPAGMLLESHGTVIEVTSLTDFIGWDGPAGD